MGGKFNPLNLISPLKYLFNSNLSNHCVPKLKQLSGLRKSILPWADVAQLRAAVREDEADLERTRTTWGHVLPDHLELETLLSKEAHSFNYCPVLDTSTKDIKQANPRDLKLKKQPTGDMKYGTVSRIFPVPAHPQARQGLCYQVIASTQNCQNHEMNTSPFLPNSVHTLCNPYGLNVVGFVIPAIPKARARKFMTSRPAWFTEQILGYPGVHRETMFQKKKREKGKGVIKM